MAREMESEEFKPGDKFRFAWKRSRKKAEGGKEGGGKDNF